MLMLREVRLLDPASRTDAICDLLIAEGKIIKIGEALELDARMIAEAKGEVLQVIDCAGLCAAPGFVDGHVHFRDPGQTWKEDIETGARAAAAGGFTSVVCMANTAPVIDDEETIVGVIRKGRRTPIHVYCCSTLTRRMEGTALVNMKLMKECGAVGFTDDGRPVMSEALVKEAMIRARRLKLPISFHEEDPRYVAQAGVNCGPAAERLGLQGADRKAEISMVERDVRLAKETGATVVIQHISAMESVELVRRAKKAGARVFAEATPHHFALTEDAVSLYGSNAKMNPPLRTEADRRAIIRGLRDGAIDMIATDHAPHAKDEKDRPFAEAPSGIIGLETAFALGIMHLVKPGHLTLLQLIARMSTEPAKLYAPDGGAVKEDAPADIVLFDPERSWAYLAPLSKSTNSPWLGKSLRGKVLMTLCGGRVAYEDSYAFGDRRIPAGMKMKHI
ncbi:MAG: dihydroorotase [Stomatobaculum sp.]